MRAPGEARKFIRPQQEAENGTLNEKEQQLELAAEAAVNGKGITYFEQDWDRGEGEFRWYGRCRRHGNRNYVEINWNSSGSHKVIGYLAEFTNLDNDYYAKPTYRLQCYKAGVYQVTVDFEIVEVADEDLGNEPTVEDIQKVRYISGDIDRVKISQRVQWRY